MHLKANTTYKFDLSSPFLDGQLALFDANGHQKVFADDGVHVGDPETLSYTPNADDTYYIAVAGFGGTRGGFTLAVAADTSLASDSVGDTAATAAQISVPSSQLGAIDAKSNHGGADADWYNVRFTAGATYRVDLQVSDDLDGVLALVGTDGKTLIGTADDGYQGETNTSTTRPASPATTSSRCMATTTTTPACSSCRWRRRCRATRGRTRWATRRPPRRRWRSAPPRRGTSAAPSTPAATRTGTRSR